MVIVLTAAVFSLLLVIPAALLVQAGVDWIGDRIEASWPDRSRGAAIRLGFRLLAPAGLSVLLLTVILLLIIGR